jgi:RNA polymerase sigma-70 factor (ECF subfamily)
MDVKATQRIEADLLARIQEGDREAFSALIRDHQRSVFFVALRMSSGDEAFARDLVQKTFLQAWLHRKKFRGEASFKSWVLRIASNLSKNELRRAWRRREFTPEEDGDDSLGRLGATAEDSFDALASKRARAVLRDAVDSLSERQREVALLRIYEDLSFAEVGSCCGISANNAKVNFHHAVRNIRKFLVAKGLAA